MVASLAAPARAQDTATTTATGGSPPLGDCWGGVLSGDPLHCYALEQAERANLIDVTALYVAPGGGPLYVWLRQSEPVSEAVHESLRAKSREFYARWPEHTPHRAQFELDAVLSRGDPLPLSDTYEDIVLHVGGEKARRTQLAWASWRQVWPASAGSSGARGATEGFDVSGVDVTNLPEVNCRDDATDGCVLRLQYPSLGFAGRAHTYGPRTIHLQLKNLPEEMAEREALKDRLYPCREIGPCTYVREDGVTVHTTMRRTIAVELIEVKYDFGELWRWSALLDRFAQTAGNTIGITGAVVTVNHGGHPPPRLYPLAELQEAEDESEWRTTIVVGALDPHGAAAALPTLLPQLGIPVDAVGVVAHSDRRRGIAVADDLPPAAVGAARRGNGLEETGGGLPVGVIAGAGSSHSRPRGAGEFPGPSACAAWLEPLRPVVLDSPPCLH